MRKLIAFALLIGIVAAQEGAAPAAASAENDPRWHPKLLAIAKGCTKYGRIDDQSRWAPQRCDVPPPPEARFSKAKGSGAHAGKLYTLFVKDAKAYGLATAVPPAAVEGDEGCLQVIVKEGWVPEPTAAPPERTTRRAMFDTVDKVSGLRPAEKDGSWYRPKEKAALFIMLKLAPDTQGTDQGWVYGTVSADGQCVSSAGRVASCMECHTREPAKDRLFGLPGAEPPAPEKKLDPRVPPPPKPGGGGGAH